MAEIELSVLTSSCLDPRIDNIEIVQREVKRGRNPEITKKVG